MDIPEKILGINAFVLVGITALYYFLVYKKKGRA